MEFIDTFYFINLDKRKDRLEKIIGELIKIEIPPEKVVRVEASEHKFGILGCVKSHIRTITEFIKSGKDKCLILEDDFEFTETKEKVNEVLTKIFSTVDFDCILLSLLPDKKVISSTEYYTSINYAATTAGYILTKEYAPLLLQNFIEGATKQEKWINMFGEPEISLQLDCYWIWEQIKRKFILTIPQLGKQRESKSDISTIL
jgi:GR25 family glycosyltransferase involved in LPS biosynthesis